MREGFEQDLQQYSKLATAEQRSTGRLSHEIIAEEVEQLTREMSAEHLSTIQAEQDVYEIQKSKQRIMERLQQELHALDAGKGAPEAEPTAWHVAEHADGRFIAERDGQALEVTTGDIMTDGEWGVTYALDRGIDRRVQKRYFVERAKQQLSDLLNEQVAVTEATSYKNDPKKRMAYENIAADHERSVEHLGIVAEKMVRTFLEKLTYDYPELDFRVERADTFQDVEEKIDFLIHRKSHTRAVDVDVPEKHAEGVQFTINPKAEVAQHKREQIARVLGEARRREHIDDIVLVSLPTQDFAEAYATWKQWQQPGGPEKNWERDVREKVFRNVLQDLFSPAELEAQWQKIAASEVSAEAA